MQIKSLMGIILVFAKIGAHFNPVGLIVGNCRMYCLLSPVLFYLNIHYIFT